jgi:hypothetical protein
MPLDDLWKLHETVITALTSKVEAQKLKLEKRLGELGVRFGGSPSDIPQPRPYPKVLHYRPKHGLGAVSNHAGSAN